MSMSSRSKSKDSCSQEVNQGQRFAFGDNWSQFLASLDEERIRRAEESLCEMLQVSNLSGKSFLDVGSGSGLFSLAARRLGARVLSFDYDSQSVACGQELKRRFFPEDDQWDIQQGSVLDKTYLQSLGSFDIVYSWGVLHHTGQMWAALANVDACVKKGGRLFISIYNDQGSRSRIWKKIKQAYVQLPRRMRWIILYPCYVRLWGRNLLRDFLHLKPFESWKTYKKNRGMSPHYDVIDWVGGFPFEVARPEQIFTFYRDRGYALRQLITCGGGFGCNQFVFLKD